MKLSREDNDPAGNVIARHVSVGLGAYLALLSSGFLAVRGLRAFRAAAPTVT